MSKTDDLFRLISSMTKAEKRYFRLAASIQGGDKSYLTLFDAMENIAAEKNGEYDEARLKKLLSKSIPPKQFPVIKNYLYRLILKTMRGIAENATLFSKLSNMVQDTAFLYHKGLYDQAIKQLEKTQSLAQRFERHSILIELADLENEISFLAGELPGKNPKKPNPFDKALVSIEKLQTLFQLKQFEAQFYAFTATYMNIRTEDQEQEYRKFLTHPLMEKQADTFEGKLLQLLVKMVLVQLLGRTEESYQAGNQIISMIENDPELANEFPTRIMGVLRTQTLIANFYQKPEEVTNNLARLRSMPESRLVHHERGKLLASALELYMLWQKGDVDAGIPIIETIGQQLTRFKTPVQKELHLLVQYTSFQFYFALGRYPQAHDWLYQILNSAENNSLRTDLISFARILDVLLHFEMNNQQMLEYKIKSVYRFLKKRSRLFPFEQAFLTFLKKANRTTTEAGLKELFAELREELQLLTVNNSKENEALEYFDLLIWLDSKLVKKPFAELYRQKYAPDSRESVSFQP